MSPWLSPQKSSAGGRRENKIGATGFEPATSRSQTARSTKLSYTPFSTNTGTREAGLRHQFLLFMKADQMGYTLPGSVLFVFDGAFTRAELVKTSTLSDPSPAVTPSLTDRRTAASISPIFFEGPFRWARRLFTSIPALLNASTKLFADSPFRYGVKYRGPGSSLGSENKTTSRVGRRLFPSGTREVSTYAIALTLSNVPSWREMKFFIWESCTK
jgi:hypothetical protein